MFSFFVEKWKRAITQDRLKCFNADGDISFQAFQLMDADKDGIISKTDLRQTFDSLGQPAADSELESMIKEVWNLLAFAQFNLTASFIFEWLLNICSGDCLNVSMLFTRLISLEKK